ncbi:Hypothetical protein CINCED_3A003467, partial [Cinara cedri]
DTVVYMGIILQGSMIVYKLDKKALADVDDNKILDVSNKINLTRFLQGQIKLILNFKTRKTFLFNEHPAFINYCSVTSNKVPASRRNFMRDV